MRLIVTVSVLIWTAGCTQQSADTVGHLPESASNVAFNAAGADS